LVEITAVRVRHFLDDIILGHFLLYPVSYFFNFPLRIPLISQMPRLQRLQRLRREKGRSLNILVQRRQIKPDPLRLIHLLPYWLLLILVHNNIQSHRLSWLTIPASLMYVCLIRFNFDITCHLINRCLLQSSGNPRTAHLIRQLNPVPSTFLEGRRHHRFFALGWRGAEKLRHLFALDLYAIETKIG
jgi:hypothetical protein